MKKSVSRLLSFMLIAVLAFSLAACDTSSDKPSEDGASYTAGTYTATVQGHNGPLTVSVDFSDDAITGINVTDHVETSGIADPALDQVPADIVAYQSLGVDTVAGATITSDAIIEAVADCVDQAGGDSAALKAVGIATEGPGEPIDLEVDVVVVGGGGAGIAASASAVQNGASVVLLEKTAALGGNTVTAGGGAAAWNAVIPELVAKTPSMTGQEDSLREFLTYDASALPAGYAEDLATLQSQITEYLAGDTTMMFDSVELHVMQTYYGGLRESLDGEVIYGNYEFVRYLCENSAQSVEWLKGFGSDFTTELSEPIGSMWLRSVVPSTNNAYDFFEMPSKYFLDNGGEIIYNTTVEKLIIEDGAVVGVTGTQANGTPVTVRAKSVVLTTGGFGANSAMVIEYDKYWGSLRANIGSTNVSSTVGEGIEMALEAGAALTGMEFTQLMPISWADTGKLALGAGNNVMYIGPEGTRFVNEYAERDVISKGAFDVGGIFYEIKGQDQDVYGQLVRVGDGTGMVFAADTLEELAEMINVPADALVAEVEKYNGYVDAGIDPEYGKNVFSAKVEGPYMARVMSPGLHHTMGGVVIDTDGHVLNEDGNVISGLYAAGEVTGGIHAGNRLGGNAIADIFTFGRVAGATAAQEAA